MRNYSLPMDKLQLINNQFGENVCIKFKFLVGILFPLMSNQNDVNLQTIENVMTEVRRNWSVMLQSDVLD